MIKKMQGTNVLYKIMCFTILNIFSSTCITISILFKKETAEENISILTLFFGLFLQYVFHLEGMINYNIHQVVNFYRFSFFNLVSCAINYRYFTSSGLGLAAYMVFILSLLFQTGLVYWWNRDFIKDASWFAIKNYNLLLDTQESYEDWLSLNVYFRVDLFTSLIHFINSRFKNSSNFWVILDFLAVSIISIFLFYRINCRDSVKIRIFLIILFLTKIPKNVIKCIFYWILNYKAPIYYLLTTIYETYNDLMLVKILVRGIKSPQKNPFEVLVQRDMCNLTIE
ncbi:hypothetical protein EDEG_02816 [Edhazardia aedis USNM 41457]|uniref:Uncharacterized protein n=1 Tax=Edhazardia aedis (strain USNM 41457) TaxID=1003232 RepID=J9D4P3_EDHAE|nr:hypothetical protein EDEG_02816 [Edhazardia aedis USNM 41457]|eukprot:EJW02776.1 hypothetical protein EDEG_02816 [Edhazardia aedis USNM 41457]